jgi:hypothetical protein
VANAVNGNTIYVDTGSSDLLTQKNIKVTHILFTPTANSNASAVLEDVGGTTKLQLEWNTNEQTQHYRFQDSPLVFPNGVRIGTLSNATLTIVYRKEGVPRKG